MFHKLNLCLGLSLFGLLAVSGAASPAHSPEVSDYDIMMEAFEAAEISHSKALDDAKDKSERRALRKAHPAYTYFQRFTRLAERGEGQAHLWLIGHTRYGEGKAAERRERQASSARTLVAEHLSAPWFEEAIPSLLQCCCSLGEDALCQLLETVTTKSEEANVCAAAALALAGRLAQSKDPEQRTAGYGWYEHICTTWPDSRYAKEARPAYNRARYLTVGGEPLEFVAKTVDGRAFKLSDFRGKVVVLDFWGFW